MAQPYYMLRFSAGCCMFEIRINDIPVITLDLPGQAASMVPINYAILETGKQFITATLLPHSGQITLDPAAMLDFDIKLYDVEWDFVFKEQLVGHKFDAVDATKKLPVERHRTEFLANVPYRLQGWQSGTNLKNVDDISFKLRSAYNRLASTIRNKQYDSFREIIAKRENIMITSMYMDQQQAKTRIEGLIADFESGFQLAPIPENAVLQIYGDGRAAALKKINGESALFLVNNETKEELMLDLMFYIPNGKTEFEVI